MVTIGSALSVLAAVFTATTTPAPTNNYRWPLEPLPAVSRGYEAPPQRWAAGHRGVDLVGGPGQSVSAAGTGVIAFSGVIAGRGVVTVQHPSGWRTTYEPVIDTPDVGAAVQGGETIGTLEGSPMHSHCAPQICLHWGLITGRDTYRDPLSLLRGPYPILIPLK